jgi:hypothetical protein
MELLKMSQKEIGIILNLGMRQIQKAYRKIRSSGFDFEASWA